MKHLGIIILLCCLQISSHGKTKVGQINNSRYFFFEFNKARDRYTGFDKSAKPIALTRSDLIKIEDILGRRVEEYNDTLKKVAKKKVVSDLKIKNPRKYYKQIIAIVNSKGEKEVWINCFFNAEENWKKQLIIMEDGGGNFFKIKINITQGTISMFRVNGVA